MTNPVFVVQQAIDQALTDYVGRDVIVACSGGPDSMSLAVNAFELSRRRDWSVTCVVVDHQWHSNSGENAKQVKNTLLRLGIEQVEVVQVGISAQSNKESVARDLRYSALLEFSNKLNNAPVLLGHTKEDQVETVLMRLVRGSGARSLAGIPTKRDVYLRPLMHLSKEVVHAALSDSVPTISDPANSDENFLRVRVRNKVIPTLKTELGADVIDGLYRTAELLRVDADYLDKLAEKALSEVIQAGQLDIKLLQDEDPAIRTRVIQMWLLDNHVPSSSLQSVHIWAVDELVSKWHGQKEVDLPGGFEVRRDSGRLIISKSTLGAK
jgi:tRNA(Ile)-lysidine synthase